MLFGLTVDCSANGMFAVNNVISVSASNRKLYLFLYKRVKTPRNCIVQTICGSVV